MAAIAAMDDERAIGRDAGLPWHLPEDLQRFSKLTRGHTVVMGRKTFESLPPKYRPLPERANVVLTREPSGLSAVAGVTVERDLTRFFLDARAGTRPPQGSIFWIIGGAEIYRQTMPFWDELYLTRVPGSHDGDVFFPPFEAQLVRVEREEGARCSFERWVRRGGV